MFREIKERRWHLYVLACLIGLFLGVNLSNFSGATESTYKYLDYFHQVYQIIKTDYVEPIDSKNIFYGAIRGIIESLNDPYSRFLDEEDFSELKEGTTGKFVGVGIEITVRDGEVVVISPIDDTPAKKAGILSEDVIVKVDDTPIRDKDLSQIVKMIRGLPHTVVKLSVRREGFDKPLDFNVERVPIKIESVSYVIMKEYGSIGYLKLKVFNSDTPRDIEEALKYFNENGVERLILDLRWNPGGLLDKAIKVSDLFLDRGKLIVSTKGKEAAGNITEFRSISEPAYRGEIVILVNRGSASASEIVAGAIRDNNRGILVGEKTFGKGSVQKFFNLDENIGVTITVAKYYKPSGTSIHGKGIIPDHSVPMEKIPEEDKEKINILIKEKLLERFVESHNIYSEENKEEFLRFLKEKDLLISERSAYFILKGEINRFNSKREIYDIVFDNQLKEAIKIINKGSLSGKLGRAEQI